MITNGVVEIEPSEGGANTESTYKEVEYQYNQIAVGLAFSEETRNKDGYKLIATGLKVNDKDLPTYLSEARQQSIKEEDQITVVKEALKSEIKRIINNYLYAK